MTEFLDLVRHIGGQAGGTASAVGILLRVTVLLLAAMLVAFALRRSSAALRHLVWTLSLVGTLLIPLCYWVLPAWQWAILPQRQPSASVSQSPIAPVTEDSPPASPIAPLAKDVPAAIPLQPKYSRHPSVASAGESFEAPVTPPPRVTEHATAVPTPRPAWSWPVFFAVGWAFGTLLGFVWLGIGLVAAWYVAWRAKPAADADWHRLLRQLLEACGIRRAIAVRECPRVSVPMTWGLRRPVILVPAGSAAWPEPIKRSVLLHELGHIRRGDCLMLLLGRLACVAYWFHPLAWLAARQLRKTSEQAADDMVLSSHIAPPDYAEHLVAIATQIRGLQLFGHVALPMASPSDLEGRVRAILDPRRNHRSLKRKTCYALMALAVLLVIPCALLRLGYAVDKKAPEPTSAGPGEVSWGEPLHGLRTRLTAPDGPEYRQGQSCTLRVEMQNASEKPIALSTMARPNVLIKAEDAKGNWLGIPREAVGVSPWEGRKDALAPDAILRWEIPLASLRFIRQIAPGTDVKLRVEGPVQHVIPGKLPIELASNSTGMMFKDAFPAVLKAADLPEKWSKSMTFVYRHIPGLKGPEGRSALQIDGNGRAILVASRGQPNVPVVEGRTEATLSQQRLDRLAGLLRQQQTWNLEQFQEIANSDEAEIRLCLISGPASMVGDFPMHVAQRQPALAAIQREAESLMAEVAAAKPGGERPAPAATEGPNASGPPKGGTTSAVPAGPAAPLLTSFGTVVDPAGKPVAGAAVYLRERLNDGITREVRDRDLNDDILATTHTGEEGTFRFENIRTRPFIDDRDRRSKRKIVPWDVVVIARPYAIAWQHLTAERQSKSMTFKLSPDATITGRVTDEKGRAMPNADARVLEIRSLSPSYISPREQFGSDPETLELKYSRLAPAGKSDAQGNVLIAGLPRGVMLEVPVGHADVEPQSLHAATTDKPQPKIEGILGQAINMETREMIGVERTYESVYSMAFSVKLGPPLPRFAGRITAADSKKPLPQTLVDGCGTFSNWFRVTDKDGRFAVNWLRPRNRYLWIKAPEGSDYLDQFLVFDLPKEKEFDPPNEKQAVPLEIELTRGEILTGTVSDVETGKGLAGFGVSFDNRATRKHDGGEPILYRAKTDNAGRFRLTVPPGKGNVLISRPGDDPGWEFDGKSEKQLSGKETVRKVEVLAGKPHADLTLKIHHSRSVVGTVLDPAGRPAAGADVGLSSWFGDNEGDFHPVQTDAQGRFAFRRIPDHSPLNPTETVIAIDRGRRLRGHIQIPNVSPAASKEDVLTIRLVPTGVVRGRVLQGDKPIAGASVHLESVPGYELYSTQTDPSGQFEFPMVEACSEIESSVQASGQHTYLRRPTEVLPGPTREKSPGPVVGGHTLELKPFIFPTGYKSLGGVVTGPNGKPVEGLYVWVYARSDGHKIEVWPEAHTGADGHFLINQVPDVPVTLVAFGTPANGKLDLADLARKDAEPGQLDVRIVFDPKLAGGKK